MARPQLNSSIFKEEWPWLILLLLIALGLRFTNITATSFWIDELYTFMVANGRLPPEILPKTIQSAGQWAEHYLSWQPLSWPTLLEALKINVHMPLYYILLNPWLKMFGTSEFGLRSFSAVVSTLSLIPLYILGKSISGNKRAGICVLMVGALVPFQIYYGQEGRMYALSLFWTTWACLALWKTLYAKKPLAWGLVYAVSLVSGCFTHYMFIFIVAFHGFYVLLWLLSEKRDKERLALLSLAIITLGLALSWWAPIYQIQHKGVNEEYHFAKSMVNWTRYVSLPIWQPMVMIAGSNNLERIFYFPLTMGLLLFSFYKLKREKISILSLKKELFIILWVFFPLILQIAYDWWSKSHISIMDRYVLLISPGVALWFGLALNQLCPDKQQTTSIGNESQITSTTQTKLINYQPALCSVIVAGMLIMAVLSVWHPSPFRDEHNKTKDIRAKVHYMVSQAQPNDLVVVNGPWGSNLIASYYLNMSKPQQPMLYWMSPYRHAQYPLPSKAIFKNYKRVWLFTYRSTNERGLAEIKDYLKTIYPNVKDGVIWTIFSS